ncbi:MAG: hypothetical protein PHI63_06675 [Patescibacteria group bacterium]|nr:hypothetical protein [Patescibacteria group bacterium]
MNSIPAKLKKEMAADPFYARCCISGDLARNTKVEWHHNLKFRGKQVQEKFAILPLRADIHRDVQHWKRVCDWIMLNRATDEQLKKYSKAVDLIAVRDRMNKHYGKPELDQRICFESILNPSA